MHVLGGLDVPALAASLDALVDWHPMLRTALPQADSESCVVHPAGAVRVALTETDARAWSAAAVTEWLQVLLSRLLCYLPCGQH